MTKTSPKPNVLIVDDDPADVQDQVRELHFDSVPVRDLAGLKKELRELTARQGKDDANNFPVYCAYVVDVVLGSDSGFEAIKCIREWEAESGLSRMPIIVYSWFTEYVAADFDAIDDKLDRCVNKGSADDFSDALRHACTARDWSGTTVLELPAPKQDLSGAIGKKITGEAAQALLREILYFSKFDDLILKSIDWMKKIHSSIGEVLYVRLDSKGKINRCIGADGDMRRAMNDKGFDALENGKKCIYAGISGSESLKLPNDSRVLVFIIPVVKFRLRSATHEKAADRPLGFFIFRPKAGGKRSPPGQEPDSGEIFSLEEKSLVDLCRALTPWIDRYSSGREAGGPRRRIVDFRIDKIIGPARIISLAAALGVFLAAFAMLFNTTKEFYFVVFSMPSDAVEVRNTQADRGPQVSANASAESELTAADAKEFGALRAHSPGKSGEEKHNAEVGFIKLVEGYLLTAVFFVASIGLVGLVTEFSPSAPRWLRKFGDLDVAKEKIVGIIVTILAAAYLEYILSRTQGLSDSQAVARGFSVGAEAVGVGVSIAVVIWVLIKYINFLGRNQDKE